MTAVIHKIFVGAGGKHTLSPEESIRRRSRANQYACHYGGEDNKEHTVIPHSQAHYCCNRIVKDSATTASKPPIKSSLRAVTF